MRVAAVSGVAQPRAATEWEDLMTFDTPSQMQVVRKQEKEQKLKDFIRCELTRYELTGEAPVCMVVARSIDSPVVRALATFSAELSTQGVQIRTVLALLETGQTAMPDADWLGRCEMRWMRNPRLIDAHEMMVIGRDCAWVGDCMRRDPQKRDAFELYSAGSEAVSERTVTSFERIWELSEPLPASHKWTPRPAPAEDEPALDGVAPVAAVAEAVVPPMPGATRH